MPPDDERRVFQLGSIPLHSEIDFGLQVANDLVESVLRRFKHPVLEQTETIYVVSSKLIRNPATISYVSYRLAIGPLTNPSLENVRNIGQVRVIIDKVNEYDPPKDLHLINNEQADLLRELNRLMNAWKRPDTDH